jgi:hypothetical protein
MNGQPCAYAIGFINDNDIYNYVLATSRGGRVARSDNVQSKFSQPGSRFATAAQQEFDAALDAVYVAEFQGYALGENTTFVPGRTTTEQVTQNDAFATTVPFVPEAQIFDEVASVYKDGDLGLSDANNYNNGNLRRVLIQFGRRDLANQPNVGNTDVETIGAVTKMINDMPSSANRQAALNAIFSINATDNTNGSSPSNSIQGSTDLRRYKTAVAIVNSGLYSKVLNDYANGIATTGKLTVDLSSALVGYNFACEGSCPTPGVTTAAAAAAAGTTANSGTAINGGGNPTLASLMALLQQLLTLIQKLI